MTVRQGFGGDNLGAFRNKLVELQERCDVLNEVLVASGLLGPNELEVRLHRRRFDAMQHDHAFLGQQSLSSIVANTKVAFHVEKFMHLSSIHKVRSASETFRSNIANRTHAVESGKLYWCDWENVWSSRTRCAQWESYDFTSNTWDTLWSPSNLDCPWNVTSWGGSIYLYGWNSLWHRYDAVLNTWHELPPAPSGRDGCEGGLFGAVWGKLYVGGGRDFSYRSFLSTLERYDPLENVWEELPCFSERKQFAWAVVSDRLYVCGGVSAEVGNSFIQHECYDAQRNVWESLPEMTACRRLCGAVGLDGCLYVLGGFLNGYVPEKTF